MLKRVETAQVQAMIEASREKVPGRGASRPGSAAAVQTVERRWPAEPSRADCTFDEFAKVDLRVARVIEAEE